MSRADDAMTSQEAVRAKTWRLIASGKGSAAWNMGVDEALMEQLLTNPTPILRFYTWERPTVSLGYFQKPGDEVDWDGLALLRGEWVRRPTGGRAVLHDDELTYAVVIREEDLPGNVIETYRLLSQALVEGLRTLGIPAEMTRDARASGQGSSSACFDAPSWYEVVAGGRKLIGSAQVRRQGVILQHGSIPITFDTERLVHCLRFSNPRLRARTARLLAVKAGALCDFLSQRPTEEAIMQACREGFSKVYGIKFQTSLLTAKEESRASELSVSKYQQEELA